MITGLHAIMFSPRAEQIRAFLRDTLGWESADAGGGWPVFAAPPAEVAVHPAEGSGHELYLMCDDLDATLTGLEAKGVRRTRDITEERWGRLTAIGLPDGSDLAIYQPFHPSP